jgi:hypothetical protein
MQSFCLYHSYKNLALLVEILKDQMRIQQNTSSTDEATIEAFYH